MKSRELYIISKCYIMSDVFIYRKELFCLQNIYDAFNICNDIPPRFFPRVRINMMLSIHSVGGRRMDCLMPHIIGIVVMVSSSIYRIEKRPYGFHPLNWKEEYYFQLNKLCNLITSSHCAEYYDYLISIQQTDNIIEIILKCSDVHEDVHHQFSWC